MYQFYFMIVFFGNFDRTQEHFSHLSKRKNYFSIFFKTLSWLRVFYRNEVFHPESSSPSPRGGVVDGPQKKRDIV